MPNYSMIQQKPGYGKNARLNNPLRWDNPFAILPSTTIDSHLDSSREQSYGPNIVSRLFGYVADRIPIQAKLAGAAGLSALVMACSSDSKANSTIDDLSGYVVHPTVASVPTATPAPTPEPTPVPIPSPAEIRERMYEALRLAAINPNDGQSPESVRSLALLQNIFDIIEESEYDVERMAAAYGACHVWEEGLTGEREKREYEDSLKRVQKLVKEDGGFRTSDIIWSLIIDPFGCYGEEFGFDRDK